MIMAYTDQAALAVDATFKSKISIAIAKAAVAVQNEDISQLFAAQGGSVQSLHSLRAGLAQAVLFDSATWTARFAQAVAADPNTAGISGSSTDNDLQFTVNAIFSAMAINH
jgi:hypothetical protein